MNEDCEQYDDEICSIFGVDPSIPDHFFTSRGKVRPEYQYQYRSFLHFIEKNKELSKKRKYDCLSEEINSS